MTKHNIKKSAPGFTITPNDLLNDSALSLKAKGMFAYLNSKPDGWSFHINGIVSQLKEGREAVAATLSELIAAGYISRRKKRANGRFTGYEYEIHFEPQKHRDTGFPKTEEPATVLPSRKSRTHSNKEKSKEREGDYFSENEILIKAYINETVAQDQIRDKRAYASRLANKFIKEDRATVMIFETWVTNQRKKSDHERK